MSANRPLPEIYDWNRPYFEAAYSGRLMLPRIRGKLTYYPRVSDPQDTVWELMSGQGTIYSYAIVWRPKDPAFDDKVPIVLATIDLDEGVQMVSTIHGSTPEAMEIGQRARVGFDRIAPGIGLPIFRIVES